MKKTFLKTLKERDRFKIFLSKMNKFEFTIYPNYSKKEVSLCAQNVFEKDLIIPKQNVKNICRSYTCKYWSTVQRLKKDLFAPVAFCQHHHASSSLLEFIYIGIHSTSCCRAKRTGWKSLNHVNQVTYMMSFKNLNKQYL